ncbi:MAG: prepilin peptidase [Chloroflexi bacterium]|nr:prepilin peptidase [Chloroflexota bacterium]
MAIIFYALAGLAVGSFLNVCIDRLPRGQSLLAPPSHCDACGRPLAVRDLVPILSYVWLRGRCRYCGVTIPIRLPLVEGSTGVAFAALWGAYGPSLATAILTVYASLFIVIVVVDMEQRLILDRVVYPAIAVALAFSLARAISTGPSSFGDVTLLPVLIPVLQALWGGAAGFLILFVPFWLYPEGMGAGDVKLAAMLGIINGFPEVLLALLISFLTGAMVAGILLLVRVKGRKDPIPFGPFLVLGSMVMLLRGADVVDLYLGLPRLFL